MRFDADWRFRVFRLSIDGAPVAAGTIPWLCRNLFYLRAIYEKLNPLRTVLRRKQE
jgi:hypothetical protein